MTLRNWIEKTGPKEVARLCGADPSTVSNWKLGVALPRPETMVRIFRLTKGKVTYQIMVEGFVNGGKRGAQ